MPDKAGGVTLEPAITKTVDDVHAELGCRGITPEELDELFGHPPPDGEG